MNQKPATHLFYADTPIPGESEPLAGRDTLIRTLMRALERISKNKDSSVIGLAGPWGSGKTSILNALRSRLKESDSSEWHVVQHTPWMFSSPDSAVAGLYQELLSVLDTEDKPTTAKTTAARIIRKVTPVSHLAGIVGVDGEKFVEGIAGWVEGDQSPSRLMEILNKEFENSNDKYLVIIDDLDRLEPSEVLNTFRTVRLLGRIPNVHYILSYDEETLTDLLCQTQLTPTKSRARDYLEKMTQLRIDVPPLELDVRTKMFEDYLEIVQEEHSLTFSEEEKSRIHTLWYDILSHDLNQPRTIKRLIGATDSLWDGLNGEADFVDYLAITYLRVQWKQLHDEIYNQRLIIFGLDYYSFGTRDSNTKRWEAWEARIQALKLGEAESRLLNLTAFIFPSLRQSRGNRETVWGPLEPGPHRGIGNPSYFERYFQNGTYSNDVSDVALKEDLTTISKYPMSAPSTYLANSLNRAPDSTLDKLELFLDHPGFPLITLLELMSSVYGTRLAESRDNEILVAEKFETFGLNGLLALDDEHAANELRTLLKKPAFARFALGISRHLKRKGSEDREKDIVRLYNAVADVHIEVSRELVAKHIAKTSSISHHYFAPVVWSLYHFMGQKETREFLWDQLNSIEQYVWFIRRTFPRAISTEDASRLGAMGVFHGDIDALLDAQIVLQFSEDIVSLTPGQYISFRYRTYGWEEATASIIQQCKDDMRHLVQHLRASHPAVE